MLSEDVKAYLIVLAAERCPRDEFLFQTKILKEFTSLVGNISFDDLRLSHLLAFDALKSRIATAEGSVFDHESILDPLYYVHSFMLWRTAQVNHEVKRIQKIPCTFF